MLQTCLGNDVVFIYDEIQQNARAGFADEIVQTTRYRACTLQRYIYSFNVLFVLAASSFADTADEVELARMRVNDADADIGGLVTAALKFEGDTLTSGSLSSIKFATLETPKSSTRRTI